MMNPNMMMGMLKQNVSSMVFNIVLIMGVGYLFSGFILAKIPFPLTQKFKGMLQQGINMSDLDVSYVSSMSWCFLLMFGLQGLQGLVFGEDIATAEENMQMMAGPAASMMSGQQKQPKDYTQIFESERDNFELMSHHFRLENIEEELLASHKGKL